MNFVVGGLARWREWEKKNPDAYGRDTMRYAERWANAVEQRLVLRESFNETVEKAAEDADVHGDISPHQFGVAVMILAQTWEYGENLRCWYNCHFAPSPELAAQANVSGRIISPSFVGKRGEDADGA